MNIKAFDKGLKDYNSYDLGKILENIYNIQAQVYDTKIALEILNSDNGVNRDIYIYNKGEVIDKIKSALNEVSKQIENYLKAQPAPTKFEPNEISFDVDFKFKANEDLKTILNPAICIRRNVSSDLFVDVKETGIWEYETIKSITNRINIYNETPKDSTIKLLNDALKKAVDCPYVLGISSDIDKERIIYLLNRQSLQLETLEPSSLEHLSYFAVKPYSNKLWAGDYTPVTAGVPETNFSNVDLDKGLNLILSKIDEIIAPENINEISIEYIEKLIRNKKLIVEEELKNKTANIDLKDGNLPPESQQDKLRIEFRNLILERLSNFYQYDGIINLTPVSTNVSKLKDHRLSISIDKQDNYNVQSSKIDFREDKPKWFFLFDQILISDFIELDFSPMLTHIEFDITTKASSPEIEASTWIQLVDPIGIFPIDKKISTIFSKPNPGEKDKRWKRILREFPPKPQILNHLAQQKNPDNSPNSLQWSTQLGVWQYRIFIKDEIKSDYNDNDGFVMYIPGDKLQIVVNTKSSGSVKALENLRNFKGFIAFWSSLFNDKTQFNTTSKLEKTKEFIDDLSKQLSLRKII